MHTKRHHESHHGCEERRRGAEMFYGYCHDTNRMRMMDYPDYVANMQAGYASLYGNPAAAMRPIVDAVSAMMAAPGLMVAPAGKSRGSGHHEHGCDCCGGHGCDCCGGGGHDCACSCCIRCADVVEYAQCGEVRRIPITFDNDTRRERDVTLQLGNFATEAGLDVGWQASVSPTQFKLAPCGETTAVVSVNVDCSRFGAPSNSEGRAPTVDSCKVVYATLRAEGCTIRPLVIAVAVLPQHCGAHHAGCGCGCCG